MRVVSLIASATEMICALGAEALLVGRSHECDFPPSVKKLPSCTEIKFDPGLASYAIDQRIKGLLQEGLSVYRVHAETLAKLQPNVIVTQIQCQVCAVSQRDVEEAVKTWLGQTQPGHEVKIVSLNPNSIEDIWNDIRLIAKALGIEPRGETLIGDLKSRLQVLSNRAFQADDTDTTRTSPRIACIEWIEPLMAAGNWTPELIHLMNGRNLFGEAKKHSPYLKFEELLAADPDVILISPCGFDIPRTRQELPPLTTRPEWRSLKAVQTGRVFLADGNSYFNRPGPRVVETAQILGEILHPDRFTRTLGENVWVQLSRS
jgi:iron complex transport system substrate-binding protein